MYIVLAHCEVIAQGRIFTEATEATASIALDLGPGALSQCSPTLFDFLMEVPFVNIRSALHNQ